MRRLAAWPVLAPVLLWIAAVVRPLSGRWGDVVPGPFGGADAVLQSGLLAWTWRRLWHPADLYALPIFHPVPDALAFMDPLLGQALLLQPLGAWGTLPPALAYNLAFTLTLLLAGVAAYALWRVAGGRRLGGGVFALAVVASPYTASQLGHLNQLPPPCMLAAAAAALVALRRVAAGRRPGAAGWTAAAFLALQAAWGWYGFAYACILAATLFSFWLWRVRRRPRRLRRLWLLLPPLLAAGIVVALLAVPHLRAGARYADFHRGLDEVRWFSADLQHFANRGAYRTGPADWLGDASQGDARAVGRDRQVLHPGWAALALAGVGFVMRRRLRDRQRFVGVWLALSGAAGLVLAFGDSVGLPGGVRLPLPLKGLRELLPPLEAFRAVWRFSLLFTLAVAWWAASGWEAWWGRRGTGVLRRTAAGLALAALWLSSLPAALPVTAVPRSGVVDWPAGERPAAVLTLPAPVDEYGEDAREALWLHRALRFGAPVTGGVSGWVPPGTRWLRRAQAECEAGARSPDEVLGAARDLGVSHAEVAPLRPGDPRPAFWRRALEERGWRRLRLRPDDGYALFEAPPAQTRPVILLPAAPSS